LSFSQNRGLIFGVHSTQQDVNQLPLEEPLDTSGMLLPSSGREFGVT
jgi:hypothetical protein